MGGNYGPLLALIHFGQDFRDAALRSARATRVPDPSSPIGWKQKCFRRRVEIAHLKFFSNPHQNGRVGVTQTCLAAIVL